ncbi:MAG: D-alanyl-D-alanine carboxypeptidase [Verrucomicrobia bacterium]|nr:D-alanyl-D-alanine carboxypeptidase [Verrucomicrobiota bacterium]
MIFASQRVLILLLCSAALASSPAHAANATRARPTRPTTPDNATAYKGAIIIDAAAGNTLFEDRADVVSPPASMTKLMTFAVLHDLIRSNRLTLETPVTVTAADSKIGGTQVWLKEKEVFPVEELLYAMMIQSANDAAYALARTAAGSVDAFVELMNAKARELGMAHTTFRTPHGLPPANRRIADGDLTTPRDFALLSRHLVQKTDVIRYTSVKTRNFGPPVRTKAVEMINHDHLVDRVDGVDGLKTGFTNGAGFCLASTALRKGRRVIVVVMGSPDSKTRDLKVAEFLERGFAALPIGGPAFNSEAPASPVAAAPLSAAEKKAAVAAPPPADAPPVIKFSLPKK